MLKIKRKALLSKLNGEESAENKYQKKSNILKWIQSELQSFGYSLTDQNSDFFINNILRQHNKLIIVEMYIRPKRGIFQNIEFRPKMYFSSMDLIKRPKIYNDRRIFHPNINIETLEIFFPQIFLGWNPVKKIQSIMRSLKYILIEPNISFVPNNEINKKAGIWYQFRRPQFRQIIFENMPLSIQRLIKKNQQNLIGNQKMQLQTNQSIEESQKKIEKQWINIKSLFPQNIFLPKIFNTDLPNYTQINKKSYGEKEWKDQEQIKALAKQMKKVHVFGQIQKQIIAIIHEY